ncbi:MAG: sugar transferase [Anaerolineae bacterium]|nr:sugar transferase [Anaerolineae bacterium]
MDTSKRLFDVVVSSMMVIFFAPLMLVIALAIRLSSPGPVLYRATRVGLYSREFKLYKFRTMVTGADQIGPGITASADPRVTPIGRLLRAAKLDELPQVFNVLRGEMSLVGPRPEDPRYVALYTPEQRQVLSVRPGITGVASVQYRHENLLLAGADYETTYVQEIMPAKLALDLEYVRNPRLSHDIVILFRTAQALFR